MNRRQLILILTIGAVGTFLWYGWHITQASLNALTFYNSGQSLANDTSVGAAAADLDGDLDLDIFTINSGSSSLNRVWINQNGLFVANGQTLSSNNSEDVALGDLNGDGTIDAYIATGGISPADKIWLNDGSGQFTDSGQLLGNQVSQGVALGDLNGDDRLDAFVASFTANQVYLQESNGTMTDSLQALGSSNSYDVALGDLNGDNHLDAFVANGGGTGQPNRVWLNSGSGVFTDTGQTLGFAWSNGVALGDLDGDQDLDAVIANFFPAGSKVWLNNGNGVYTATLQTLGTAAALAVALDDLDSDGDLDAVLATTNPDASEVWLNQGDGTFVAGPTLSSGKLTNDVNLADFDGDDDLDVLFSNFGPDEIWLNGIPGLPNAQLDIEREQNAGGLESAFWTESGDAQLDINLTQPAGALLEVKIRIESAGGTLTKTIPFTPGQNQGSVTVSNPQPNPEESVKLSVFIGFAGAASEDFNQTDVLNLVFVDDVQGMPDCILCYMEWLLRFFGFNPSFGSLHHVDYGDRPQSAQWAYYTSLFDIHSSDLAMIVATHPIILLDGYEALESWTPALESFNSGGGTAVTQKMTDDLNVVLDRIEAEADGELATLIAHERAALAIDDWPDLTAAEWWDDVVAKRPITSMYLPIVAQQ